LTVRLLPPSVREAARRITALVGTIFTAGRAT